MMGEFSANASAPGYFYQCRYALFLLLSRAESGAQMFIERLDDISFGQGENPVELLQTRHQIKATASLSDASTALWKTLKVWSVAIAENRSDPGETILTLVTTGRAPKDSAASKLRPHTIAGRDSNAALKILYEIANQSDSQTNRPAYDAFLKLSEKQQRTLMASINLLDASPSIPDMRGQIQKQMRVSTNPKLLASAHERIESWWFNRLIQRLSSDSSSPILYRELLDQLNDVQKQYNADNLRIDFLPTEFADASVPVERNTGFWEQTFIEQLRLVVAGEPQIRQAINDYHHAFQQRSRWVREDLMLIAELEGYENRLVDEWKRLFGKMKAGRPDDADELTRQHQGQSLLTSIQNLTLAIHPRCDEPCVMRGSFHILANQLRVGWHANFIHRLSNLLAT